MVPVSSVLAVAVHNWTNDIFYDASIVAIFTCYRIFDLRGMKWYRFGGTGSGITGTHIRRLPVPVKHEYGTGTPAINQKLVPVPVRYQVTVCFFSVSVKRSFYISV
jgi:hypothetical protein